jgi:hypothetical protein
MEPILGRTAVAGIQNRPIVEEVGFARLLASADAREIVDKEAAGRFGIGKEEVVWSSDVWIPVAVVQLTLLEIQRVRRQTRTSQAWTVYDLLAGTFVTRLDNEPARTPVHLDGPVLAPKLKLKDPAKTLDDVITRYEKVTSEDAKGRYRQQLANLGVPALHTATTGGTAPFLYPLHVAIVRQKGGTERVIAVDSFRSRVDADLGLSMSRLISWIRESIAPNT